MYSALLIDLDPIRAFDLYIKLEDEGFCVCGPVASEGEGFRVLKDEQPDVIFIDASAAATRFPELYNVVMESNVPVVFIETPNAGAVRKAGNTFVLKDGDSLDEVRAFLDAHIHRLFNSPDITIEHIH